MQGPLINAKAIEKVEGHVADATARGARVSPAVAGSARGTFYTPTVLCRRDAGNAPCAGRNLSARWQPCSASRPRRKWCALRMDTPYGLAAYFFYTGTSARAFRVADEIEAGMIGNNAAMLGNEVAPFGGVKESRPRREWWPARHRGIP